MSSITVLPIPVCKDYNTALWCSDKEKCKNLHICKYYVCGRCRNEDRCNRYHGIPENKSLSKAVLQKANLAIHDAKLPDGVPLPRGNLLSRPLRRLGRTYVYFDLETTGFEYDAHIIQISAVVGCNHFNKFIKPVKPIALPAAKHHNFKLNKDDVLTRNGYNVITVSIFTAINLFIIWLSQFNRPMLIAHNCKAFTARVLVSALKVTNTFEKFNDVVVGFLDSLPVAKKVVPQLKKFTLKNLYYYYHHSNYPVYDAFCDSVALAAVMQKMDAPLTVLLQNSFDCVFINWANRALNFRKKAEKTLIPLVKSGHVTKPLAKKIAKSGLDMSSLTRAYEMGCIRAVLAYNIDGKPRVSMTNEAIKKIQIYFNQHCSDKYM